MAQHVSWSRRRDQPATRRRRRKALPVETGSINDPEVWIELEGEALNRYELIIFWSDEDEAFVADVPELPGCVAHGASHEDALRNAKEAIQLWIDSAREAGVPVPEPKGRRLMYA
jgi:predicted RNase H-like HicB family nuclease